MCGSLMLTSFNIKIILLIKETIVKAITDLRNLSDSSLIWEFIKCQKHTEAISHSVKMSKESNNYLASMGAKLRNVRGPN